MEEDNYRNILVIVRDIVVLTIKILIENSIVIANKVRFYALIKVYGSNIIVFNIS